MVCKRLYASVNASELGLNNNSSTDTYNNAGGSSVNDIIDKNIRDLEIKFGTDNIPIENHQLPKMYWIPCILNCHIIHFWWYLIVWLISVLMKEKVNILQLIIMELVR